MTDTYTPTAEIAAQARKGLEWRDEYNRGGTEVGVARARDLSNRRPLSEETVRRMKAYFDRHEVDKQGTGWSEGSEGFPSAGRIAWLLWGGDPGRSWANRIVEQLNRERQDERGDGTVHLMSFEVRSVPVELRADEENPLRFSGRAVVYGSRSLPGVGAPAGEVIAPGALSKTLSENRDLPLLWAHDLSKPLASTRNGSLRLIDGDEGLDVEAEFADTTVGRDTAELVRSGVVGGMSFGFRSVRDGLENIDGQRVRVIRELRLFEVSVVPVPAYPATTAEMRAAELIEELRVGRVLSSRNAALIKQAIDSLSQLLAVETDDDAQVETKAGLPTGTARAMLELSKRSR